jgi:hypothetical protein
MEMLTVVFVEFRKNASSSSRRLFTSIFINTGLSCIRQCLLNCSAILLHGINYRPTILSHRFFISPESSLDEVSRCSGTRRSCIRLFAFNTRVWRICILADSLIPSKFLVTRPVWNGKSNQAVRKGFAGQSLILQLLILSSCIYLISASTLWRKQCLLSVKGEFLHLVQVDSRQAEIDRLTTLLDGGRPYDVVALEARNRGNERLISHLNIQVSVSLITWIDFDWDNISISNTVNF